MQSRNFRKLVLLVMIIGFIVFPGSWLFESVFMQNERNEAIETYPFTIHNEREKLDNVSFEENPLKTRKLI